MPCPLGHLFSLFQFIVDLHVQTEIHLCFLCGWDYKKYVMDKWNAHVNNAIFKWVVVSIKMSLPLFIFSDVSVELYTLDLVCPWNMNYLHWLHKTLCIYMYMWLLTQVCLAEHQKWLFPPFLWAMCALMIWKELHFPSLSSTQKFYRIHQFQMITCNCHFLLSTIHKVCYLAPAHNCEK